MNEINKNESERVPKQIRQHSSSILCFDIPARFVLYFLSWSGFMVSFMMRNDINFTLIAMVKTSPNQTEITAEFDWNSKVTSWILGSFYLTYVPAQIIGGIASQRFGTKKVFGWSQLATALGSLCIPFAASTHWSFLIFVRSFQGFVSGFTWPAMYHIVPSWIPQAERSRFMSSFQGNCIGIGIVYPLSGFIIKNFGWRPVFYTTGSIGILWCIMWYFLAFDTPQDHPRISKEELQYIEQNVAKHQHLKIPWKSIFKSLPAWSIGITTFGRIWLYSTFVMQGPSFMKNILNFDIQSNGILSGLPYNISYFATVFFCYIADLLVEHDVFTLTDVRKLMSALSQIVPGILVAIVGFLENYIIVVIIWSIAVIMITAAYAGAMASIVDIAPNLSGPVLAFCQTVHMSAMFISPLVNGFVLKDQSDLFQWQLCFFIATFVAIFSYGMFQVFGTADIQDWNYPKRECRVEDEERLRQSDNNKEGDSQ